MYMFVYWMKCLWSEINITLYALFSLKYSIIYSLQCYTWDGLVVFSLILCVVDLNRDGVVLPLCVVDLNRDGVVLSLCVVDLNRDCVVLSLCVVEMNRDCVVLSLCGVDLNRDCVVLSLCVVDLGLCYFGGQTAFIEYSASWPLYVCDFTFPPKKANTEWPVLYCLTPSNRVVLWYYGLWRSLVWYTGTGRS